MTYLSLFSGIGGGSTWGSTVRASGASAKSRTIRTAKRYSANTGQMFRSTATSRLSREKDLNTPKSSSAASPAKGSARRTTGRKGSRTNAPDCGRSISGSFAIFDRDTWLLKTLQPSLFAGSTPFSAILPPSGSMRSGRLCRRQRLVRPTEETEFSLWPTPQASDAKRMKFSTEAHLKQQARNRRLGFGSGPASANVVLHCRIEFDGCPTANFVEWLMGYPMNWTDTSNLETP